jgi:hypothetical protein
MVVTDAARETNFDVVSRNVPRLGDVIRKVSLSLNLWKGLLHCGKPSPI